MSYWLIKSEPEEYSYDMLARDGKAVWTGVRGFAAMKNLRSMKPGDTAFYYHTGDQKAIVGICKILTDHFVDPTSDDDGPWVAVEIGPVGKVPRPVTLAEVKADPQLQNTALAREPRLSVQPLTEDEYNRILTLTQAASVAAGGGSKMESVRQSEPAPKPIEKKPIPAPPAKPSPPVRKASTPPVGKTKSTPVRKKPGKSAAKKEKPKSAVKKKPAAGKKKPAKKSAQRKRK